MSDEIRSPPSAVELDERRRRIYELLSDRVPRAAQMYYAAIAVFATELPNRLEMCAHEMREFIEKLPHELEGVPSSQQPLLGTKARELVEEYELAVRRARVREEDGWTDVDRHLSRLLQRLRAFAEWFRQQIPSRREEAMSGLRLMDPSPSGLPRPIVESDAALWLEWRKYFNLVSHHLTDVTDTDFEAKVAAVEELLLRRLAPPTFENQEAIARLIAEVEADAQPDR